MSSKRMDSLGQAVYTDSAGREHPAEVLRVRENGRADLRLRWEGEWVQRYAILNENEFRAHSGGQRSAPRTYWRWLPVEEWINAD